MVRKIMTRMSRVIPVTPTLTSDLRAWLESLMVEHGLTWLLTHCENGVIWGIHSGNGLKLSSDTFPRVGLALRWDVLVQARLFGETGELLVWPGSNGWLAHLRDDQTGEPVECLDEQHLLWGTSTCGTRDGFSEVVEGQQGIVHAPPISIIPTNKQTRASLIVRHYLAEDEETGVIKVVGSRLVAIRNKYEN